MAKYIKGKYNFTLKDISYKDINGYNYKDTPQNINIGVAGTAQMIRQWMKQKYPQIPSSYFWVRSESYSGGDSIKIYLNDAPNELYDILNKELNIEFEEGSFNGMDDSYTYTKDSEKSKEGLIINYGTKYLFVRNNPPYDVKAESVDWSNLSAKKPSTPQKVSFSVGELIKECQGWMIYKNTLPDGRIVYNAKIKPNIPPNKGDWQQIKNEVYINTGFKWGKFGSFDKWGQIASEEAVLRTLCEILDKYYKSSEPQVQSQPQPNDEEITKGMLFKVANDPQDRKYVVKDIKGKIVEVGKEGQTWITTYTLDEIKNYFKNGTFIKVASASTNEPSQEDESVKVYIDGEFISEEPSTDEAKNLLIKNFGEARLSTMRVNNRIFYAKKEKRIDVFRESFVYGEKWGVPKTDGNILQNNFSINGYRVFVSKNRLIVYKTDMATDGMIITDNGGEFNLDRYGYNENIGSVNYIVDDKPISPNTAFSVLDDLYENYFKNLQTKEPQEPQEPQNNSTKEDIEKAIKGLQFLADKGNEEALKAIKGLQYLLNK